MPHPLAPRAAVLLVHLAVLRPVGPQALLAAVQREALVHAQAQAQAALDSLRARAGGGRLSARPLGRNLGPSTGPPLRGEAPRAGPGVNASRGEGDSQSVGKVHYLTG